MLNVEERSQTATEFLLMLGAILAVVAGIVASIFVASRGLGSSVRDQIDNVMENSVTPGLIGALKLLE